MLGTKQHCEIEVGGGEKLKEGRHKEDGQCQRGLERINPKREKNR